MSETLISTALQCGDRAVSFAITVSTVCDETVETVDMFEMPGGPTWLKPGANKIGIQNSELGT
jgi:hypothetical protein